MFGDPKSMAQKILGTEPDGEPEGPERGDVGKDTAAEDLINAIHGKDVEGVKSAFRALFDLFESEPHEEAGE